ncbi:unnamed protein product, partial [Ostreobium quekettii]
MAVPQALRPWGARPLRAANAGAAEGMRAAKSQALRGPGHLRRMVCPMACSPRTGGEPNDGRRRMSRQKKGKEKAQRPQSSWNHGPSRLWGECSGPPEVWTHWGVDEMPDAPDPVPASSAAKQTGPGSGAKAERKSTEEEFWMYSRTPGPAVDLLTNPDMCILLAEVYVVMFGVGEAQKE